MADLGADGTFEVAAAVGSWSFPELEVLGQFEPPNPLLDGAYRELYGCFARPVDLDGACTLLRPQADGLLDPLVGKVMSAWNMGDELLMRGLTAGVVRVDGAPTIWGVDGDPALGVPSRDRVLQFNADGSLRWAVPFLGVDTPSIADVDGDEEPEMCVSGKDGVLWMLEADGALKWRLPGRGPSPIPEIYQDEMWAFPQCVLSDLDADGRYEAVFFDQRGLRILDGATGRELASNNDYVLPGGRWWQSPTVADVDGDGSAEIVTMAYRSDATEAEPDLYLVSFGAAEGRWARTRPVWNEYAYDVTSIGSDGELVSWPVPSWEAYNTFRAQPSFDGAHPDLVPVFIDLCVTDGACDMNPTGEILVSVQIENRGSTDQPAGAVVRLFTKPEDACYAVAAEHVLPEPIAAGWSSDAVVLTVAAADWGVRQVVEVWYDVPNLHPDRDCDLVNNRLPLEVEACPD